MKAPRRAFLLAFLCLFTASDDIGAASGSCTDQILLTLPSPDGAWRADVDESVCDLGFSSAVAAEVRLFSADSSAGPTVVVGVDTGGHDDERPRLAWTADDRLQVTVPNISFSNVTTRRVGPISVDVVFDPPDPEARAAWLRRLKQDETEMRGK